MSTATSRAFFVGSACLIMVQRACGLGKTHVREHATHGGLELLFHHVGPYSEAAPVDGMCKRCMTRTVALVRPG